MSNKKELHEIFTPTKPARLTFVERDKINDKLVNSLRTPGKQLIVYGHSGSGKTTLLVNKLHQLYEFHITTRCMQGITFEQIILDAFDQLNPFYTEEIKSETSINVSAEIKNEYLGIKTKINSSFSEKETSVKKRVLPPQLTPQALAKFIGETKACWVIEDFHKVDEEYRTLLSQIMKVFMDMADDYRTLKIIAIGAVNTARLVVKYDREMNNRVSEIMVPLMDKVELKEILVKGETLLNIKFPDEIKNLIIHYSNGIAAVCHNLALNICISLNINETVEKEIEVIHDSFEKALKTYIDESSDSLKEIFDKALKLEKQTKFDNYKIVVKALSFFQQDGATKQEIFQQIKKEDKKYPSSNLSFCLDKLRKEERSELIKFDEASGKYSFYDPFYRVFALVYFKNVVIKQTRKKNVYDEIPEINLVEKMYSQILEELKKVKGDLKLSG